MWRYVSFVNGPITACVPSANSVIRHTANVLVWMGWQTDLARSFMPKHFLLSMESIKRGRIHTLVTCFFSHFSIGHLLTNLLVLYFFSPAAIMALGTTRFLQVRPACPRHTDDSTVSHLFLYCRCIWLLAYHLPSEVSFISILFQSLGYQVRS